MKLPIRFWYYAVWENFLFYLFLNYISQFLNNYRCFWTFTIISININANCISLNISRTCTLDNIHQRRVCKRFRGKYLKILLIPKSTLYVQKYIYIFVFVLKQAQILLFWIIGWICRGYVFIKFPPMHLFYWGRGIIIGEIL